MASSLLLKYVNKERKETFLNQYNSNKYLFSVFESMLYDKLEKSIQDCEKISVHEYSNQIAYLADQNGYRRAVREILALLPNQ